MKQYIEDVMSGRENVCKWVKLAIQRHVNDLERDDIYFDERAAAVAIKFFQLLRHSKGEFAGKPFILRPWQEFVIGSIFGWMRPDGNRRFRVAYIEVPRKNGKALSISTPIPTPNGWVTMENIGVGDVVFDENGKTCKVTGTTDVMQDRPCYKLSFSDGTEIVADENHEWLTSAKVNMPGVRKGRDFGNTKTKIRTTKELFNTQRYGKRNDANHTVQLCRPLILPEATLPIPPYTLGAWLGDGNTASARITNAYSDIEIIDNIRAECVNAAERKSSNDNSGSYILGSGGRSQKARDNSLQSVMRRCNLLNNKHIPAEYLRASYDQRLSLLKGLMDTDGYASKAGQCEYTTTNETLAQDVLSLIRTFGLKPTCNCSDAKLNGRVISKKYRIQFWANGINVFSLQRKTDRIKESKTTRAYNRSIVSVEPAESEPVKCIEVDSPSHLYLAGDGLIPTHNSTLGAGVGLYMLTADGEAGAQIYTAATKYDQARIVHDEATRMVENSPALKRHCKLQKCNIMCPATGSFYRPLGRDSKTLDGLNPSSAIIDELHAHPDGSLYEVIDSAFGARSQPLILSITTAGNNAFSYCKLSHHNYIEMILDNNFQDDDWFGIIYSAEEGDDPHSAETWKKANPNFDIMNRDDFDRMSQKAQNDPASLNNFLIKRLNIWTTSSETYFPLDIWLTNNNEIDPDEIKETPSYVGCDISSVNDITAVVQVCEKDGKRVILPQFFIPEDRAKEREKRDRVPYYTWATEGFITLTPGSTIDYDIVINHIVNLYENNTIQEMAYDPWGFEAIRQKLIAEGISEASMFAFRQTIGNFSEPMKMLYKDMLDGNLITNKNPVLAWMASNVCPKYDCNENVRPDKEKSSEKIDGIVAALMAYALFTQSNSNEEYTPYLEFM